MIHNTRVFRNLWERNWQLAILLPTVRDTPRVVPPRTRRLIVFESGGQRGRIIGFRLRNLMTRANIWLFRLDWHPHPRFPRHCATLHFHVPPDMNRHHFIWPRIVFNIP